MTFSFLKRSRSVVAQGFPPDGPALMETDVRTRPRQASSLWQRLRSHLFGNASRRQIVLRIGVDFCLANLVLMASAVVRHIATGQLDLDDPINQLISRVNLRYVIHATWFCSSAIVLFTAARLYRPLPSSRIWQRLIDVSRACLLGFVLHLIPGVWQNRIIQTLQVAAPAWALVGLAAFTLRYSWMTLSSRYRMVPRQISDPCAGKVEDVLVVGGAGYIGSVLTSQLLDRGYRVRILDNEMFGRDSLRSMLKHPRLEFMSGDFRNVEHVVRALRNTDAVIHLAAIVGDPACALDRETTIAVNYAAARMMAQLARADGISRFVFASTCSVYGESDEVRDESSALNPVSIYATTKIDAERALLDQADDVFQPTILRFATAYGWSFRPRFDLVANLLSAQAVTDRHIRIFNGDQWRPFVHTRDIARACVMAMEAPLDKVGCQIFNVGDDSQNCTLRMLGQIVSQCVPETTVEEIENGDDHRNYRVDFTRIRDTLGFRASVDLHDGVAEMVEAVRSGRVVDWRHPIYSNVKTLQEALQVPLPKEPEESSELLATRRFLARAA